MSFVETHDVLGMTCDHYARAVRTEVSAIAGVTDVNVDVTTGVVRITAEQIRVRHGAPRGGRRGRLQRAGNWAARAPAPDSASAA
jgi:hypothetical protein